MDDHPRIEQLAWDDWNREHLKKHHVTPEEAAEVLVDRPVIRDTYKNRYAAIGPTRTGRMLTVIVGPDPAIPNLFYVFSARPASRRERRIYQQTFEEDASP
jgi:uncharacterized DUF497 family protein